MQNQRSKSWCSHVFYDHFKVAIWERKESDVANSRGPGCFFFFVTLHKLLISGGFVWNKYVCASAGSALLSDIALGHSSISLSLSLCLSVWGGGWRGIYRASDCRFSLKPLLGQIPHLRIPNNIPHTPLARNATTVWTVQGLILGTKWGRNRAMPRCVFVFVPVQHWCGAPKKKKKKMAHRDAN